MHPGIYANRTSDRGRDRAAIIFEGGRVVSYRELDERSIQVANLFRAAGLGRGDHVAFCLENHPEFLVLAWGAQRCGVYYTAIGSRLKAEEVAYIVNDCGAKAFITSRAKADVAEVVRERISNCSLRLMLDGVVAGFASYEEAVGEQPRQPQAVEIEGSLMLYTSGTTGHPKGVLKPASFAPLGNPDNRVVALGQKVFGMDETTVYLSPGPLYHAAPLKFSLAVQRLGGTVVVMKRFDAERALQLIAIHGVTHSQWVPTMFIRMLRLPEAVRTRYDLSSHRVAIHAAAPCPIPIKRQMIDWWGPILHEYYAGTEGTGFTYCTSQEWLAHPGTVGRAIVGKLHILDQNDIEAAKSVAEGANGVAQNAKMPRELPVGQAGAIYFEEGGTFEYFNDPDKTNAAHIAPSWNTLGDVGYLDEEGYLYLTDRKAFTIISGGVNIYPREIESVLIQHPSVVDVAVIGVPNEEFGEEVKAIVQPADIVHATPALEQELIAFAKTHLSSIKCPRTIDFRATLPRSEAGKLQKKILRQAYWQNRSSRII
ncbi:MAG: AMP-binding protein [Ardenticatenaceae bacterium]